MHFTLGTPEGWNWKTYPTFDKPILTRIGYPHIAENNVKDELSAEQANVVKRFKQQVEEAKGLSCSSILFMSFEDFEKLGNHNMPLESLELTNGKLKFDGLTIIPKKLNTIIVIDFVTEMMDELKMFANSKNLIIDPKKVIEDLAGIEINE